MNSLTPRQQQHNALQAMIQRRIAEVARDGKTYAAPDPYKPNRCDRRSADALARKRKG